MDIQNSLLKGIYTSSFTLNLVLLLTDADSIIVMCFLSSESTEMSDAEF